MTYRILAIVLASICALSSPAAAAAEPAGLPITATASPQSYRIDGTVGAFNDTLARIPLDAAARQALGARRTLRVGVVRDMRPLTDVDLATQSISGAGADYLQLIGTALGLDWQAVRYDDAASLQRALQANQVDIGLGSGLQSSPADKPTAALADSANAAGPIDAGVASNLTSLPYLQTNAVIVAKQNRHLDARMTGQTLVFLPSALPRALLAKRFPAAQLIEAPTHYAALEAVALGRADAYVGDPSAVRAYANTALFTTLAIKQVLPDMMVRHAFHFAPADAALVEPFNAALARIPAYVRGEIERNWLGAAATHGALPPLALSAAEHAWLAAHPVVRVAAPMSVVPFAFQDSTGRFAGITANMLEIISQRTGIVFEPVFVKPIQGTLDTLANHAAEIGAMTADTPTGNARVDFTTPFLYTTAAIVTRNDNTRIHTVDDLRHARIALLPGQALTEALRRDDFSVAQIVNADDGLDALDKVATGKADATVMFFATANYFIGQYYARSLKIVGTTGPAAIPVQFSVRPDLPELRSILDKALAATPREDINAVVAQWGYFTPLPPSWLPHRAMLRNAGIALALVLSAFLIWHLRLRLRIAVRRRAELQLRGEKDTAEAANQAKTMFLATMSHEIRTPMNVIIGVLEMLRGEHGPRDEAARRQAALAFDSATSLMALLNDILEYSRAESGEIALNRSDTDLAAELRDIAEFFSSVARRKGITLTAELDPALPPHLQIDRARLRQVLNNLLSNALKFTDAGSVTVSARVLDHAAATDIHTIRIDVSDTGIGLSPAAQASVFEPFKQHDAKVYARYGGTGMGLAICRRLAQAMGGTISLTSTAGHGTCVSLQLPFTSRPLDGGTEVAAANSVPAAVPFSLRLAPGAKLLIVDDHPANQLLLETQLSQLGVETITASNGEAALRELAHTHFDAVITDCNMPGMDGYELTRAILAAAAPGQAPPIIGYSADASPQTHERCEHAGMLALLVKPVSLEVLRACLLGPESAVAPTPDLAPAGHADQPADDLAKVLRVANNRHETALQLIEIFQQSIVDSRRDLAKAVAARDHAEVAHHAHYNKGPAKMMGFEDLFEACSELSAACVPPYPDFDASCRRFDVALERCSQRLAALRPLLETSVTQ